MYVSTAMLGVVLAAMVGYTWHTGVWMSTQYAPLQCASMELREHATAAHLWTEEILSGDTLVEVETVWERLDRADWYAQVMLEGSINPQGTFLPLDEAQLRDIRSVQEALADLRALIRQRLEEEETPGPSTEIDRSYDSAFDVFVDRANAVEMSLKEAIAQNLRGFRLAQAILAVTAVLLVLFIVAAFRRFEQHHVEDLQAIKEVDKRLRYEIARHRQTLEALEESEWKYRAFFQSTGTATAIIEEDTTLSKVNSQFEELSGYSKEELEGKKSWTEFVVKEDLEEMKKYHRVRRVAKGMAPTNYEFRFVDRHGNVKDLFLTVDVISGTTRSVVSLLDITESKRAENRIREHNEFLNNR